MALKQQMSNPDDEVRVFILMDEECRTNLHTIPCLCLYPVPLSPTKMSPSAPSHSAQTPMSTNRSSLNGGGNVSGAGGNPVWMDLRLNALLHLDVWEISYTSMWLGDMEWCKYGVSTPLSGLLPLHIEQQVS